MVQGARPRVLPLWVGLLVLLLLLPAMPGPAVAASLDAQRQDAERRQQGVESRLDDANDELSTIERRHAEASARLEKIEGRIAEIEARLAQLTDELEHAQTALAEAEQALADTEQALAETEEELAETRAELAAQQELFSQRVRGAFKRNNLSLASAVFAAEDVNTATRAARYVQAFMDQDRQHIETIAALEARTERSVARLDELRGRRDEERLASEAERDRIAGLVVEQEELHAEAESEAQERRALVDTLEKEEREYARLVTSLEAESAKLERRLADIAAEEARLAEQRRREQARRRQVASASRDGSASGQGQLLVPVQGRRTSPYGYRTHPITGVRRLHAGMDFGAPTGTPIRAAESGTVVTAGGMGGYGVTVVISHGGGMSTLYAHQSRLAVGSGQRVNRGDVIGYVGSTGLSTGPHLHFEVRINGAPVNPVPYL